MSRSDSELLERCRDVLVRRFQSDNIWLNLHTPVEGGHLVGPASGVSTAVPVTKFSSGETEVSITAESTVAEQMRGAALPVALGLSVVLELRSVLLERQGALDDAVFQLRALRQVARLLSSVHSTTETERLILDFMAEVFFTWWGCLYRPAGKDFTAAVFRSRSDSAAPPPIAHSALEKALPPGCPATSGDDVALATLFPSDTKLVLPLDAGAERLALLALGPRLNDQPFRRAEIELADTLGFAAAIALKNAELVERLHSAATTDELTGLYNRRALEERLEAELSRGSRHQLHTAIVLLDIDHFKPINDTLGHAAGDHLLTVIAELVRGQCRTLDVVGRLGGDEFLVILPMTKAEEAMVFVKRVQKKINAISEGHPEYGRQTVSLGVAEAPLHGTNVNAILSAADSALYAAKRGGRNTVAIAESP